MIWQPISLSNRLPHQSPTRTDQGRQWRTWAEDSGLKSGPPLMNGLDVHENIDVSDTKLMLGLRVCSISPDLTANKLFPINPRAVTGPPKMSLVAYQQLGDEWNENNDPIYIQVWSNTYKTRCSLSLSKINQYKRSFSNCQREEQRVCFNIKAFQWHKAFDAGVKYLLWLGLFLTADAGTIYCGSITGCSRSNKVCIKVLQCDELRDFTVKII